jgi:hypothetical protein
MRLHHLVHQAGTGWTTPLPAQDDSPDTLVLAFAAPGYADDWAPFAQLAAAFPRAQLIGCSTAGEIAGAAVHDASISATVVRFEGTRLRRATATIDSAADSRAAGARLAEQLAAPDLRAVFVLSDGLCVNGSALVEGLAQRLPPGIAITGALAGDGSAFQRTWLVGRDGPQAHQACAIGFHGERLRVGHGCDGGWHDFGPERRITRAEGNVLFELDGRPALDLYKTYLGERAAGLPGTALLFPLAVRRDAAGQDSALVRTILGIDEERHALIFAGDLPQGGIARLMRANADQLIDSAARAARQAMQGVGGEGGVEGPVLVVSVSCVGRRLVLGERTDEEVETVAECAPPGAVHLGLYSYGEISPAVPGGMSELHNQTMTVTTLCEAAE